MKYQMLPHARPGGVAGLLELLLDKGGRDDIYRLADDLAFEIDDLLPIVDAAQLLGFLKVEEGDASITPNGAEFANSEILRQKELFRDAAIENVLLLRQIRERYRSGEGMQLGIERKGDGVLIGTCTLFHFMGQNRRAELGYVLGSPYWRQGYMHEALQRLLAYAFDDLGLIRLEADIDPRNEASERTLLRLGFVKEGYMRERWIVGDVVSDSAVFGLLRREWTRP